MKPFDLEKARNGHPIQLRDGRKAKVDYITSDRIWVIAGDYECSSAWFHDGRWRIDENGNWDGEDSDADLFMVEEAQLRLF